VREGVVQAASGLEIGRSGTQADLLRQLADRGGRRSLAGLELASGRDHAPLAESSSLAAEKDLGAASLAAQHVDDADLGKSLSSHPAPPLARTGTPGPPK
jgi:hypothetical protein